MYSLEICLFKSLAHVLIELFFFFFFCLYRKHVCKAAVKLKNLPPNSGDLSDKSSILGWEDPLEKEMATHSSIFAWRIPWTEEPDGLTIHRVAQIWRWLKQLMEKEMATHSSVLAWRITGTGSLVGCRLWGRTESDTTEAMQQQKQLCTKEIINKRKRMGKNICKPYIYI